jgi:NAD(P)-dependent dehydrogenase (short-subunit alcohol dehydrogenase family)
MMSRLFDLSGKVAIVTGSTKGIGRAIAAALADHGAKVVVSSRDKDRVADAARELSEGGRDVLGIPCNVGRKEEMQSLVDATRDAWGQIDIAVGNAAINPHYGPSTEIPDEIFAKMMHTNIQSNLWLAQMVADEMRARKDGAIIFTSSIGGLRGSGVIGTYGITKAADMQLARNLAIELGPDNIRVNCIAPGLVKTDFARALWEDPAYAEPRIASTPLRRLGEPEDIAGIAVYLASAAGRWTTGQTIVVDGGATVIV